LLVGIELFLIHSFGSNRYISLQFLEPGWEWLLFAHVHSKYVFVVGLGLLVGAVYFDPANRLALLPLRPDRWLFAVHVGAVAAVLGLQQFLPLGRPESAADAAGLQWLYLPATAFFVLSGITAFLLFVPVHKLSPTELKAMRPRVKQPATIAVVLTLFLIAQAQVRLARESDFVRIFNSFVEQTTLDLSLFFYSLLGFDLPRILVAENGDPILARGSFAIQMAPDCAGYQGMMAAMLAMSAVLVLDRRRLHLPKSIIFAMFTVGMVFVMNAVRIAFLLYIGIHISEEVAIGGFHSNFGTLSLLMVVGIALVALQHPFFERAQTDGELRVRDRPLGEYADLVPFIMPLAIMLAMSFAVGTMQGDFNWFYGVAALVGAGMMWAVRGYIRAEMVGSPTIAGLICGVGVYALWIAMVPTDPERVTFFKETFESVAAPVIIAWIVIRVLGSSIVVPVLEELAFRGGLQRLIARAGAAHLGPVAAMVVAVALSSLAFGLMHADILAATLAGVAYGALAAWRGRIGDAIIAHAVTNFLIAIHVLALGEWSYW